MKEAFELLRNLWVFIFLILAIYDITTRSYKKELEPEIKPNEPVPKQVISVPNLVHVEPEISQEDIKIVSKPKKRRQAILDWDNQSRELKMEVIDLRN